MWRFSGQNNHRVFTLRFTLSLVAALILSKVPALEALSFEHLAPIGKAEFASAKTEPTTADLHSVPADQSHAPPGDHFIDRAYHGYYSSERIQLHEKILNELLSRGMSSRSPRVILTSGPFGAGKTSVVNKLKQRQLLSPDEFVIIDMDEIRERLPEFSAFNRENPETASHRTQLEAGYIAELLVWRAVKGKKNILIDSSLGSVDFFGSLLDRIAKQERAYKGHFQLLHVRADLVTIQERVALRNAETTRFTPPELVQKKYEGSIQALERILPKFDAAVVIDNTDTEPRVVFHQRKTKDGKIETRGLNHSISDIRAQDRNSADIFTSVSNTVRTISPNRGYDAFIDLDWTILYSIQTESQKKIRTELNSCQTLFQ